MVSKTKALKAKRKWKDHPNKANESRRFKRLSENLSLLNKLEKEDK